MLVAAGRADIDDAGLAVGVLLQADDLGVVDERVAGKDRLQEAAIGIAEIGDGIERDVGHRLAEHDVEDQQIVDRRSGIADSLAEGVRGLHREARPVEGGIERDVAGGQGARRRMEDRRRPSGNPRRSGRDWSWAQRRWSWDIERARRMARLCARASMRQAGHCDDGRAARPGFSGQSRPPENAASFDPTMRPPSLARSTFAPQTSTPRRSPAAGL